MDTPGVLPSAPTLATFGAALRFLRLRARLSQRELAAAVGYSEGYISRLEGNRRRPAADVVAARFVAALGIADDPAWSSQLLALAAQAQYEERVQPPGTNLPLHAGSRPTLPPVLALKVRVPPIRATVLHRPRLTAQLDRGAAAGLTLVIAPAGAGKTTLLAAWASQPRSPGQPAVVWLTLDADDDDLGAFVQLLVEALRTVAPAVGATTLALLQMPEPPAAAGLMRPLLNDLLVAAPACVLILDDLQLLTVPAGQHALRLLVEHCPPQVRLILAGRAAPALPLARLRARQQLAEIGAAALRWSADEAATFLHTGLGLQLEPTAVSALVERTEGRITGLLLAGLALREHPDPHRLLQAFAGSNRYVADYLTAEVLAGLAEPLRRFIVQTAILEQLCGPLCDAVLDQEHRTGTGTLCHSAVASSCSWSWSAGNFLSSRWTRPAPGTATTACYATSF